MHITRTQQQQIRNAVSTLLFVALLCALFVIHVRTTDAAPNLEINYQGKLTDSSNAAVSDGTYNMRFWLLTSDSVATTSAVWTEELTGSDRVQVTNGLFSVMLGSTTPLDSVDFNQTLYLGVEIGGTGGSPSWDGEMSPRKVIGTVPAAFEAQQLDGIATSSFLRSDQADTIEATENANALLTVTQNGTGDILNLFDGSNEVFSVLDGGNVGIGTSSPSSLLNIHGGDGADARDDTTLTFSSGYNGSWSNDGTNWYGRLAFYAADTSGTPGAGNRAIIQAQPGRNSTGGASSALTFWTKGDGDDLTERLRIGYDGNVGIGTTSPSEKLTISGGNLAFTTANSVVTGDTGLTLQQTGDTFGTTKLHIQNRTGVNGAMFEQAGSVDLVDFVFKSLSNQRNIRFEDRSGNTYSGTSGNPEFQIGVGGDPTVAIGDSGTVFRKGSALLNDNIKALFGTGSDASIYYDGADFQFDSQEVGSGNFIFSGGNVGIGTTSPSRTLTVGGDSYFGGNVTATGTLTVSGDTSLQQATTTDLAVTGISSSLLKTTASGALIAAIAGTDYVENTSGDWTGTFDGQEGTYYTDATNLVIESSDDWTGTLDSLEASQFLRSDQANATATITDLTFTTATGTTLVLGGDTITDFAGTGLTVSGGNLTADLGTSIDESELNITGSPTDGYVLQASSTATGGFVWNATTSLGFSDTQLTEDEVEAFIFDADNSGTLSSGTLALDSLSYTGTLDDANVNNALTVSGGTIGSNNISGTLTTTGTLTIGDGGDRIDIASDTWDVTNGTITGATWNGAAIDFSTYTNATAGDGIAFSGDDIQFSCAEVEGTGINCSTNNITLDATGDWTGTFDGEEGSYYLDATNLVLESTDDWTGLFDGFEASQFLRSDVANATATITDLTFDTATGTNLYLGGDLINEFAGAGLTVTGNALTADLGTSIDESELNIVGSPTDGHVLWASSTAAGGFAWTATSTLGIDGGGSSLWTQNGSHIYFSSGHVGIGSTSPLANLTVSGDGVGTDELFRLENGGSQALFKVFENGSITFGSSTATTTVAGGFDINNGAFQYNFQSNETSIERLNLGAIEFEDDAGVVSWIDLPITTSAATGTVQSYSAQIDSNPLLTVFGKSDGQGGVENLAVGIGTTSPWKRLSVQETVSDAQFSIAYDDTRYANFQVNSAGDLIIDAQGGDIRANDENLYVCSGGSCPTGSPAGTGNTVVENNVLVGTTTVREQLTVQDRFFIGNGGVTSGGLATSTIQGDLLITGKLDVPTIDPVYTIGGVKYATYGHATIGIKEEATAALALEKFNEESGYYEKRIAFSELEQGSDLWLFYQVSSFGERWQDLVVNLTPSFDGSVFYEKLPEQNALLIKSSQSGEVSARFIADRFDSDEWPNLREDQNEGYKGFILDEKP